MTSTSLINLTCLCGSISAPGSLLKDTALPIDAEFCHCNSCQYSSGALGVLFLHLNSKPSSSVISKLVAYPSSETVTRYFCPSCGCHCFFHHTRQDGGTEWYCLAGNAELNSDEKGSDNLIKMLEHIFIPDTIDGGLTPCLLNVNQRSIPTWSGFPIDDTEPDISHAAVLELPHQSVAKMNEAAQGSDDFLSAKCHCGGVSLLIKRKTYPPDLVARYTPKNRTKYLSYMCACRSCRLTTGVPLIPWATVPPANILDSAHAQVDFAHPEGNQGTTSLKSYRSSTKVVRSFCGTCGATVGYVNEERRDEVDLVVGLFRAEEGSMARGWLEWEWGRCSFAEDSTAREISEAWKGCKGFMDGSGKV